MYALISLEGKQKLVDQLLYEIKYALKDFTAQELRAILLEASKKSIKNTYQAKKNSILNLSALSKKALEFGKTTAERYKTEGLKESAVSDLKKMSEFAASIPEKVKNVYDNFLSLLRDKQIETVASVVLVTAIYLSCCGGLDAEGGLPDMDITVAGIGHHRSIFSHSIILGLGVEFSGRFMVLTLEKMKGRLPENHHPAWDKVYDFIEKNQNRAIAAMWLGIGTHLIKDSGLITGGVKPYADLPVHMTQEAHQATFAINGAASGAFSTAGEIF